MHIYFATTAESINVFKMFHLNDKFRLLAVAALLGMSATSFAAGNTNENVSAYVDSVYEWGSWELGLMPAAGGAAPSPQRAVATRNTNVQFRPNDNSAYTPDAQSVRLTTVIPAPMPAPVPVPVVPTGGPAVPGQPPVTGGPGDRFN